MTNVTISTTVKYFGYVPEDGAAWAAMSMYIVLGLLLCWTNFKNPPCKFMIVLVLCAWFEAAGYGLRVLAAHSPSLITFIWPTLFILLVPNAIALVNYIVVGRALAFSGMNVGCLRPNWIARTFFISDVLSFCIQGFGGGLLTSTNTNTIQLGEKVILVGLSIQCASLFLFLFCVINIHMKPQYLLKEERDGQRLIRALYVTTVLLFIRSVYRAIEYGTGKDAYIQTHEWPFYVFDTIAIMSCYFFYILPTFHYGRCLNELRALFSSTTPPPVGSTPGTDALVVIQAPNDKLDAYREKAIQLPGSVNHV